MKLTKDRLKKIIKEELEEMFNPIGENTATFRTEERDIRFFRNMLKNEMRNLEITLNARNSDNLGIPEGDEKINEIKNKILSGFKELEQLIDDNRF